MNIRRDADWTFRGGSFSMIRGVGGGAITHTQNLSPSPDSFDPTRHPGITSPHKHPGVRLMNFGRSGFTIKGNSDTRSGKLVSQSVSLK
ncbi:hypothetical protein CDAR_187921 [Caerostris darwini]|uniref:Uncharacterized protein n=1 Tax=Caerostris darwini TaxID=1538125 RepID=A0AAV4SMT9_9ARAC|nr:hypothetical protein CDAR_187921 [Caerostris darwini]